MTSSANSLIHLQKTGGIAGILSVVFYFLVAVLSFLPDSIALGLAFSFPLLWIIAFMGLYQFLKAEKQSASLEIAYLFGIIGAAIACMLLVVQQANFIWHAQAMEQVATEEAQALLKATFRGANRVQAGMDVAFDIFITIAWFLFGVNIARSAHFNKLLGWLGCLIAAGLLTLNMITFPTAPAEAGLFDLGPFLGIWALVVYIWFTVVLFKRKDAIAN
ncbi:MAG: hypothetical protein ACO20F_12955 [Robiginitalea sp.]|jgi:hypothetical protein